MLKWNVEYLSSQSDKIARALEGENGFRSLAVGFTMLRFAEIKKYAVADVI